MSRADPIDEVGTVIDGPKPASPVHALPIDLPLKIGRFTVLQLVGAGGMGKVYAAYDPELDRKVAVKLVHRGIDTVGQARLQREALALAKVSHPHVVAIHEVGLHDGEVFMAMEFVTGVNLRQWLHERPRPWREVLSRFIPAGEGLQAVHALGFVHRDFKPENLLLGTDGRVRLADFGLVGITEECPAMPGSDGNEDERLTVAGTSMGTPAYMSPEQHQSKTVTSATDIFSFCVSLYEGLYGERPFHAPRVADLVQAKLAGAVHPAPAARQVPAWLRAVVLRGLAVAPEQRWPSMKALLAALADDPDERRRRRLRFAGWLLLAALGGLVVVLAVGAGLEAWRRADAEALAASRLTATLRRVAALAEADDEAGAAATFAAFVGAEEHRGTRALSRAWLAEAARLRRRGDLVAARAAYASAYSSATDPAGEQAALLALADMLFQSWSIDHLEVVLTAVEDLAAAPVAEVARWRIETMVAQRDLRGAEDLLTELGPMAPAELAAWTPVVHNLGQATQTEHVGARVVALGDGRIALANDTTLTLVGASPSLPVLATIALPERLARAPWVFASKLHHEVWLLGWRELAGGKVEYLLYTLADDGVHEQLRWEDWLALSATMSDAPEGPRLYIGLGPAARNVVEVRRSAVGWVRGPAHPATDAAASDIVALAAADLDGDGREELTIAAGPWRAYDLRVLRRPNPDARFELVAREKLGYISALAPLRGADGERLLAAAKTDRFPNPALFPDGQHYGEPAGIHLLALDGAALRPAGRLPLRDAAGGPAWFVSWMEAGDIDGDGREDLVSQISDPDDPLPSLAIDRQLEAGRFVRVRLRGLTPRALVDLDDDPQRELIVEDGGRLWVLGAGEQAPPRLPARHPATLEVQPQADPILVETQRRAEQLVAMGLGREAAELLDHSVDLASEPQAAAMLRRAADLYVSAGAMNEAGRTYDHLARLDGVAGLWGGARLHHEGGRVHEALARVESLLARDDVPAELRDEATALQRSLAPLAHPASVLTWTFDQPLAEGWRIADPIGFRRHAIRGVLRIDAFVGGSELAAFPIAWDGGPLSLAVDLTIERLEWGGQVTIGLRPVGARTLPIAVGVEGVGGQASLAHRIQCFLPDRSRPLAMAEIAVPGASTAVRGTLQVELHAGRMVCAWTPSGGETLRSVHAVRDVPAPGEYELVVVPAVMERGQDSHMWAAVHVHRIEVGHARASARAAGNDPLAHATRLHAEGDVAAALAAYPHATQAPPQVHVWRSAALFDLGEPRAAEVAAEHALGRDDDDLATAALDRLLRLRPQHYGPLLRSRAPEHFARALHAMWRAGVVMNPDAVTLEGIEGLLKEDVPADMSMSSDMALTRLSFLSHRGRVWARRGEHERARRDLRAALAAAGRVEAETRPIVERRNIESDLILAHVELAALAMRTASLEQAREHVSAALARASAPELVLDALWVHPALVDLHDDPAWRALLGRGGRR